MSIKQTLINTFPNAYERITSITGVTTKGRAQGVDLYGPYQGYFRPEIATQCIDFAIQKLTEGITIRDPRMGEIWDGVKQIGMRGAYHYQRSGISWRAQADYFLSYASKYDHHFIANDVEKINNQLNDSFVADMYRIVNYWTEQVPGKRVVLYSNKDLLTNFIYPRIKALYGGVGLTWLLENVDIWYAQYWLEPSVDKDPALPSWMTTWRIWQITDTALKPLMGSDWGLGSKDGDIDVFNGTPNEMRAWLGLTTDPDPDPDPEPEPPPIVVDPQRPEITPEPRLWSAEVLPLSRMIVRTYPLVTSDTATTERVYGGELFKGRLWSGNNYVWIRIDEYPQRPAVVGKWVAVRRADGLEKFIKLRAISDVVMPQLWQVLHDIELGVIRDPTEAGGTPETFPLVFKHFTKFNRAWQLFSYELMGLPAKNWRKVFTCRRALSNRKGFECPDWPRADHVNKLDLDSEDPKVESLLFGGNVITGRVDGDWLWVETLNGNDPPPSVAWVKERPWLTQVLTNVSDDGNHVFNFPQGGGLPVVVPILTSQPVKFPLKNLRKLPLGSAVPSVYWP